MPGLDVKVKEFRPREYKVYGCVSGLFDRKVLQGFRHWAPTCRAERETSRSKPEHLSISTLTLSRNVSASGLQPPSLEFNNRGLQI